MADDAELFPTRDAAGMATFDALGTRRSVSVGDYLYREGDATYDFYVVVSGAVEIVVSADGNEQVITRHGPGRFLGELNLLTGMRVFVSARVAEPGEVIAVPRAALQHVIATSPRLGDTILAAFLARRSDLLTGAASTVRVVGSRFSPESLRIREFLARSRIPHEWLDPDGDEAVDLVLRGFGLTPSELPVVIATGPVLRRPTPGALAEYLGLTVGSLPERCFDLVVVGGGPAGLAAAVYGASEGLRCPTHQPVRGDRSAGRGRAPRRPPIGRAVVVAGGGNSAGQAALFLADAGSPTTIVIRGPDLASSMSRYLIDRIEADPRVAVRSGTRITGLEGDRVLRSIRVTGADGEVTVVACAALFSFIGADPASDWLSGCAALDERGFVVTDRSLGSEQLDGWEALGRRPLPFETSHPGLFAVGDVRAGSTKRVAAAVGEGSAAVGAVHEYLAFGRR